MLSLGMMEVEVTEDYVHYVFLLGLIELVHVRQHSLEKHLDQAAKSRGLPNCELQLSIAVQVLALLAHLQLLRKLLFAQDEVVQSFRH